MQRQVILDTETTGLSPQKGDRIIEVGLLELVNRRPTGRSLQFYFNPDRMVDAGALRVHGISNEFLQDKPRFYELAPQIMEFVTGAELIIHNAEFDLGFLNYELSLLRRNPYGKMEDHCPILDTLVLARKLHPGQRNSLDALCKRYDINNQHRDLHGALLDAEILAHVFLAMTGGQEKLFSEVEALVEVKTKAQKVQEKTAQYDDLVFVEATPLELAEHQSYLDQLA
ncbi:MAG: DNA polymerase III subunit epsilon [Gammaproteobacteria bacterium]|nr:DNA polymerase III subunit epsilon [Gammaproteobacteria bacterium]